MVPETTVSAICELAPKVARACSSKPESAVSTTTCVLPAGLLDRPIRMTVALVAYGPPGPLTGAAGAADVAC